MVPFKFAEDLPLPPSLALQMSFPLLAERLWPRIGTLFSFFSRISREEKRTGMGRATLLARTAHAAVLVLTFSEFKTLSLPRTLSNLQSGLAFSKLWVLRRWREGGRATPAQLPPSPHLPAERLLMLARACSTPAFGLCLGLEIKVEHLSYATATFKLKGAHHCMTFSLDMLKG